MQPANFSIAFTGRQSQNILIMWYRNGVALYHTNQHQLIATFSDESMTGTATIQFPEMSRVNGGVYRVVVSTDFGANVIPENLRRQEVSFQVEMRGENISVFSKDCLCVVYMIQIITYL